MQVKNSYQTFLTIVTHVNDEVSLKLRELLFLYAELRSRIDGVIVKTATDGGRDQEKRVIIHDLTGITNRLTRQVLVESDLFSFLFIETEIVKRVFTLFERSD